ncbi:MAG TPA: hypothetical protein VEZ24_18320 [Microvirga sp.]|nr:hypothetical protein [Microvirga sp.]
MSENSILPQEIGHSLNKVRGLIRSYSGLYCDEDLARDVLKLCDEAMRSPQPSTRVREVRRLVHECCVKLVRDADRFSIRDPALIARSRARAIAAVDMLQDALLEQAKADVVPRSGSFLRRRSL